MGIWFACAVSVAGLLGLVLSGPVRMSAASCQRHVGQLTLCLLLSSLSDSTGLGHLTPLGCAQPPQLSGNGGWRRDSASHFSWPQLRPLSYSQPLQLLTSLRLSAASLSWTSAHLRPLLWALDLPAALGHEKKKMKNRQNIERTPKTTKYKENIRQIKNRDKTGGSKKK